MYPTDLVKCFDIICGIFEHDLDILQFILEGLHLAFGAEELP